MAGILVGATVKGILVGVLCGLFARKCSSVPKTVAFGAGLGFVLASLVALGNHYYLQTMIPGLLAGALIGYLTQRMGQRPAPKKETANA